MIGDFDEDLLADLLSNDVDTQSDIGQSSNVLDNSIAKMNNETNDCDADLLNDLLSNNSDENSVKSVVKKSDFNFMDLESNETHQKYVSFSIDKPSSLVRTENASDSSDEEDRKYFEKQTYSTSGREIKNLLKKYNLDKEKSSSSIACDNSLSKSFTNRTINKVENKINTSTLTDVYSDPIFGLRMIKPLVSSSELKERMTGRLGITVSKIKAHITSPNVQNDWVIAGVLIKKSETKTSQKGSSYSIWKISDLSENIKTVSVFLFSSAQKTFWKTILGSVIGILNPKVLESRDNYDEATISVDNPQKIMVLGQSKDMGKCKSAKNNGELCNSIINLSHGEYCVYHVKKEYKKFSRRVEVSSGNVGIAPFNDQRKSNQKSNISKLPNMQPFTPVLAKRNEKLYSKDQERLALLSGTQVPNQTKFIKQTLEIKNKAVAVELTSSQVKKDFERLNKLKSLNTTPVTPNSFDTTHSSSNLSKSFCLNNLKDQNHPNSSSNSFPQLNFKSNDIIDISEPITKKHIDKVKINALQWIAQNGKIKPNNPNKIGLSREERIVKSIKRQRSVTEEENVKKKHVISKFQEMMKIKSNHTDLIERSQEMEKEKYFNRLEMKEKMEEKMMNTFTVNCKAVKCLKCKYTAFSSSGLCKEQRHPIKVIDAVKRFFKCSDCGNRTVSLDRIPSQTCNKCNSSNWRRAAMMDDKKTNIAAANLSIRGGEETFLGSTLNDANLNLLVPMT